MTVCPTDDFGQALRMLRGSMDNLATSTIRARNREFPPVEITTRKKTENSTRPDDYKIFCTDRPARDAEFARRKQEAITAWYRIRADSDQSMREITIDEAHTIHQQVEQQFVRELNDHLYHHPEAEYRR